MYACRAEEKANENDAIITSSTRNLVVEKILLYCPLNLFSFKLPSFSTAEAISHTVQCSVKVHFPEAAAET